MVVRPPHILLPKLAWCDGVFPAESGRCRDYRGAGRTGAVCGNDETGVACVMRESGKPAPSSASCMLVDDQFAYIPVELADTFFREHAAPTAAFAGPNKRAAQKGKLHYVRLQLKPCVAHCAPSN